MSEFHSPADAIKTVTRLSSHRKTAWQEQQSFCREDLQAYVETYTPPTITCPKCRVTFAVGVQHYCTEDCQ